MNDQTFEVTPKPSALREWVTLFFSTCTIVAVTVGIIMLTVGCGDDGEWKRREFNQRNVNNPERICNMPDGRTLYCIRIDNAKASHYHFIYFFSKDDTNTVSINSPVSNGKTTVNQTIVLDGTTYQLVPTTVTK